MHEPHGDEHGCGNRREHEESRPPGDPPYQAHHFAYMRIRPHTTSSIRPTAGGVLPASARVLLGEPQQEAGHEEQQPAAEREEDRQEPEQEGIAEAGPPE